MISYELFIRIWKSTHQKGSSDLQGLHTFKHRFEIPLKFLYGVWMRALQLPCLLVLLPYLYPDERERVSNCVD